MSDWEDTVAAHKARYRDRIIDAAVDIVADRGVTGLTMARLAQEAGIGRATLYKYFPDVEHVLLAHLARHLERQGARLRAAVATHGDPRAQLRAYLATLLGYLAGQEHRGSLAHLGSAGLSQAAMATLAEHQAQLLDPLEGVLHALRPDLDARLHARMVLDLLGPLHEELITGRMDADQALDLAWSLLIDGLTASGS